MREHNLMRIQAKEIRGLRGAEAATKHHHFPHSE